MQEFEILAPVKDEENFYQALFNGADAVYLGLKDFNARQKASTFGKENLRQIVELAHFFGVKVYVALNTIVTDGEFDKLIELVSFAVSAKVDAFIVQDLGVAKVLKTCFKNIVLHASTQLGVHNLAGAKVCEKLGFSRVVLSRETTLEDIKDIKQNTNLELEYFVQGALCVAFSGACYLSSIKHDCSGNRGKCLQLCRLCYTAEDKNINKKGYFLSPTDLCFIDKLKTLYEAGICSFKIEGRLRRPSYVALTSKYFSLAKKSILSHETFDEDEFKNSIQKVFYRGEYNNGHYFESEPKRSTINTSFQNHRGVLIGKVLSVKPFKDIYEIVIQSKTHEVVKNDGLKFVDKNGYEQSMGVGSVKRGRKAQEYIVYSKTCPKANDDVYLTVDFEWESKLLGAKRALKFDAYFVARQNENPKLILTCKNSSVEAQIDFKLSSASTQGLTKEQVKENLEKTNNLPLVLDNLECIIDNVFLPKSKLNEIRRLALERLYLQVVNDFEKENNKDVEFDRKAYEDLIKKSSSNSGFAEENFICVNEQILNSNDFVQDSKKYTNFNFVLSPSVFELSNINNCFQKAKLLGFNKFYLDLPKVLRWKDSQKLFQIISTLPHEIGVIANNIYTLNFCGQREVVGGAYLNIANNFSAQVLSDFNIKYFVKSFENFATQFNKGIYFEGKPALMTFCHCPYKTIYQNDLCKDCKFTGSLKYKNEAGEQFYIRRTKICRCTFELVDTKAILQYNKNPKYIDLR